MPNKSRRYEVRLPIELDEDMAKMAERLKVDRSEVFRRAMALYIRAKNAELDEQAHVFLEDREGKKRTELVGV